MITVNTPIYFLGNDTTPIIHVVQGDSGRTVQCIVSEFSLPEGATAVWYVDYPDTQPVYANATITGNVILVDLTSESIADVGESKLYVRLTSSGQTLTSFPIVIKVVEAP